MRLHSSVSRSRGRLVVLKLGVFVGLLIFLMVATIACDNTEPLLEPASIQESTGTSALTPTPDGTDVSQSPSPHIDPASREAEGYAAHHGVSLEEAQNRSTLQRLAGELNAVLSDREGRTFAGLWIEHTPQFRVVVQFTRDAQETIARHIQNVDLAEVLEVRTADVSLAELREAQSAAMEAIGSANIPIESGIDIKAGRVKVYVAERDRLDDEIERGRVTLPDNVDLARIHRCGAALGLEQGVRAVGRDGPRSIPITGAGGGLWLELVAPMAVLGSGAGAGSAGQHAREDNRGPGRCDSVGWLSSLVDVSGAVGAVRQAMAGLAIEPGRE